jgi:hypothetical protein
VKFESSHPMVGNSVALRTVNGVARFRIVGVDIIMDPLNGEDSVRGFDLLKPLGRIIYFGRNICCAYQRATFDLCRCG